MGKKQSQPAGVSGCHAQGGNQAWSLTGAGELRSDELCLLGGNGNNGVQLTSCDPQRADLKWTYDEKVRLPVN
jgi:hypothetical protein